MSNHQDPAQAMREIQAAMESMQQLEKSRASSKTVPKSAPSKVQKPKSSTQPQKKALRFGKWLSRFFKSSIAGGLFLLSSPILLVKGALWLHLNESFNAYISLAAATGACIVLSALVVGIFLAITTRKAYLKTSFKLISFAWLVVLMPLMLWSGLAGSKDNDTASEYQSAHPLLKMAVSTYALFDRDVIMTDISRTPEDYQKMGLSEARYSKHFEQTDGYVHAVDLRTINRPEWQNKVAEMSFNFMGFNTLRHVGTADHLHVSIP